MPAICFLRTNMDYVSGATVATLALAEELAKNPEYQIHIVSIYGDGGAYDKPDLAAVDSGISFYRLSPGATRLRESFFRGARAFREYVKQHKIDLVCSVSMSPLLTMLYSLRGLDVKRVFIEHSSRSNKAEYGRTDEIILKIATKRLDAIVVLTNRDKENYRLIYKVPEEKIKIIPNWISEESLAVATPYDPSRKKLITVGRPSKVKGFDMLVQVAALLKDEFADWKWNIYGDGELFDETLGWIKEAGVENFVFLKGNDPEVLKRYGEHSIFVMTSYFEGLPLSLLEARANHLPAVAFDCPTGPREAIVDGEDGFLIPCYEIETMAARLAELMRDENVCNQFAKASEKQRGKFSKPLIFAQWYALLESLIIPDKK